MLAQIEVHFFYGNPSWGHSKIRKIKVKDPRRSNSEVECIHLEVETLTTSIEDVFKTLQEKGYIPKDVDYSAARELTNKDSSRSLSELGESLNGSMWYIYIWNSKPVVRIL